MEKVGNIPKIKHLNLPADAEIAINCKFPSQCRHDRCIDVMRMVGEWGNFRFRKLEVYPGLNMMILSTKTSNKPGQQAFEK